MNITLGPVMPTMDTALRIPNNPDRNGYGNNPRCLRRDVNNYFVEQSLKGTDLASQITTSATMTRFQDSLQNDTPQKTAIHSSGHFSIWGDPGGDVYVSPGEPVFWLHHGQIDRHWWMWANYLEAEVKTRTNAYEGESDPVFSLTWLNCS
jgi:tyrosinase